jgi:hypothetical protein
MTTKQGLSESFQVSLELFQKHWKTIEKFESCPVRFKTKGFPKFFAFLANCFGVLVRPCWLGA